MDRILYTSLLILTAFLCVFGGRTKQVLTIKRFGQCLGKENITFYIPDMKIQQKSKSVYVISGEIRVGDGLQPNLKGWRGILDIKKCDDAMNEETCSPFMNRLTSKNICEALGITYAEKTFSTFIDMIKPKILCPFHKGIYVLDNIPIQSSLIDMMPVSTIQNYDLTIKAFDKNELKACIKIIILVRPVRS